MKTTKVNQIFYSVTAFVITSLALFFIAYGMMNRVPVTKDEGGKWIHPSSIISNETLVSDECHKYEFVSVQYSLTENGEMSISYVYNVKDNISR